MIFAVSCASPSPLVLRPRPLLYAYLACLALSGCTTAAVEVLPDYARPWQQDVVYQIYPRSFADSDGDGVGDLRGIIGKVGYLHKLGVGTVWLSPVYKTTNWDNGYDITDYLDIDPQFGTLADWFQLRDSLHDNGMKLIMDLVINHTSDEHPWFVQELHLKELEMRLRQIIHPPWMDDNEWHNHLSEVLTRPRGKRSVLPASLEAVARAQSMVDDFLKATAKSSLNGYPSAEESMRRLAQRLASESLQSENSEDFYIWRPRPSNWRSCFGGSAWHYRQDTALYYLALFSAHQPDLNWANPLVRRRIEEMIRTWVARGIDGFRMDSIDMLAKDRRFLDVPVKPGSALGAADVYYVNQDAIHAYLREISENALAPDLRTVGELPGIAPVESLQYTAPERHELNEGFLFGHMDLDYADGKFVVRPFPLIQFKSAISAQQESIHERGWIANFLESHDQLRAVSRFANDREYRVVAAKMLGTLLFTLEGSPYIYQGQEIAMTNASFSSIGEIHDVEALNYYEENLLEGRSPEDLLQIISARGRDNMRTAMQWDDSLNAGFSSGTPWNKVNDNYRTINVRHDLSDPSSPLSFYRWLMKLRSHNETLLYGGYTPLLAAHPHVFAFTRTLGSTKTWTVLNFSADSQDIQQAAVPRNAVIISSNYVDRGHPDSLRAYEARVYSNVGTDYFADR